MARGDNTPMDKFAKKKVSENLNRLMELNNKIQKDVQQGTKIPQSTLVGYIKGERLPNSGNIQKLADFFNVGKSDIDPRYRNTVQLGYEDDGLLFIYNQLEQPRKQIVYDTAEEQLEEQNAVQEEIAVYGGVAANPTELTYGDTIYDEKITTDVPKGADGAVTIHGDSMEDFLYDGDIAFFKKQPDVENGEIAIVEIDESGVTCKKVVKEDGKIILRSLNSKYEDRVIEKEKVRIIGKVVK